MKIAKTWFLLFAILTTSAAHASSYNVYTSNLPPFTIDPEQKGFAHEILEEVSKRTGIGLDIQYFPWKRAQKLAQSDSSGMIFSLGRTSARENRYSWVMPLFDSSAVFVTAGKPVNSLEEAKALDSIVVLYGTPRDNQLKQGGFTNYEPKTSAEIAAKFLEFRRADAWYTLNQRALYLYNQLGFDPKKLVIGDPIKTHTFWLAGNRQIEQTDFQTLRQTLEDMKADGSYDQIISKYTGDTQ